MWALTSITQVVNSFHLWSQQCIFSTKTRLIVGKKLSTLFESQQCIISTTKRLIVAKRIVVNSSYILLLRFVCERQRFIKLNVKGQEDKRFGVAEGSRAEVAPPTDRVINMGVIPWQAHKHRDSKTLVSIASNLAALLVICFMARNREEISRLESTSWRSALPESGQTLIWVTILYIVPTKRKLLNLNKVLKKPRLISFSGLALPPVVIRYVVLKKLLENLFQGSGFF